MGVRPSRGRLYAGTGARLRPSESFDPALELVDEPPRVEALSLPPELPRGTAWPEDDDPPRRWSSRCGRSARCGAREAPLSELLPIHALDEPDELSDEEPPDELAEPDEEDPEDDELLLSPRGSADPTVSEPAGRSRCPAHAGARLNPKATARTPVVNV